MAFSTAGQSPKFRTQPRGFAPGYGIVIRLETELPQRYDVRQLGPTTARGLALRGAIEAIIGARSPEHQVGDTVDIVVRPGDQRQEVFADILKANEGFHFLLEGVSHGEHGLEARWAHGAGGNRKIEELEIVGPPHVSFENPIPNDGPRSGWLRLNLDGTPTGFDLRAGDGSFAHQELSYDTVVQRLRNAMERNLRFRISQRVLFPSKSVTVNNQDQLDDALSAFRQQGYVSCIVRTFIPGTTTASEVDVQVLTWPLDQAATSERAAVQHEMPTLEETPRFVALRDNPALALIEVIPGYVLSLVGNSDPSKSTKHTFVRNIIKGLSEGQKSLYATQNYGPGIGICALSDDGVVTGLTRLALRTEGVQYRNLFTIPTQHFSQAYRVRPDVRKESTSLAAA